MKTNTNTIHIPTSIVVYGLKVVNNIDAIEGNNNVIFRK